MKTQARLQGTGESGGRGCCYDRVSATERRPGVRCTCVYTPYMHHRGLVAAILRKDVLEQAMRDLSLEKVQVSQTKNAEDGERES